AHSSVTWSRHHRCNVWRAKGDIMVTLITLWIAVLVLLVLFLARSVRTAHRVLGCPIRRTNARVTLLEALPEGRPIALTECSEFSPTTAITCDRHCLRP